MPRIPYRDLSKSPPSVVALTGTAPINAIRLQAAASPAVFEAFYHFGSALYTGSKIAPDLRELAVLRVGYLDESRYETFQHEEMARRAGLSDAQIESIKTGGPHPATLSPVQQAVLDFTDDVVKNVRASDASLATLLNFFSDEMAVDLIMLVGYYSIVTRLLETAAVELEKTADAWQHLARNAKTVPLDADR
jgi:alkylhydroperoxidase family enzyme